MTNLEQVVALAKLQSGSVLLTQEEYLAREAVYIHQAERIEALVAMCDALEDENAGLVASKHALAEMNDRLLTENLEMGMAALRREEECTLKGAVLKRQDRALTRLRRMVADARADGAVALPLHEMENILEEGGQLPRI